MHFQCPRGVVNVVRHADMFVDDMTAGTTSRHPDEPFELEQAFLSEDGEADAQMWEELLHFSGGSLELPKSSIWAIVWESNNGKDRMLEPNEHEVEIRLTHSETGHSQTLESKGPHEAERNLGVRTCPAVTWDTEYIHRREESLTLAGKVTRSTMSITQAQYTYSAFWLNKMRYPFAVTSFTEAQCKKILGQNFNRKSGRGGIGSSEPQWRRLVGCLEGGNTREEAVRCISVPYSILRGEALDWHYLLDFLSKCKSLG